MANNDINPHGIKQEVSIAVFALLINFGYFKIGEINQFVEVFASVASPTITPLEAMSIGLAGIFYTGFVFLIFLGVLLVLLKREALSCIAGALFCMFGLYLVLLMRAFDQGFEGAG